MGLSWFADRLTENGVLVRTDRTAGVLIATDRWGEERRVFVPDDGYEITTEVVEQAVAVRATDIACDQWFNVSNGAITHGLGKGIRIWQVGTFFKQFREH